MRNATTTSLLFFALSSSAAAQSVTFTTTRHAEATKALESNPNLPWNPTAILVRFQPETGEGLRSYARSLVGRGTQRKFDSVPGLELIDVRTSVRKAIATIRPYVEFAEPDFVVRPISTPNDTFFDLMWGLDNTGQTVNGDPGVADADIDAPEAWNTFTGDPDFVIAIIDTGTQYTHPDLAANIWTNPGEIPGNGIDDDGNGYVDDVRGWDFWDSDNDPDDGSGHGTHTAGTVGAVGNNGTGVTGVNWHCKLMPLRFLGPNGGYTSDAILAVQYANQKGVKVSNNSWGGGGFSQGLYNAIDAGKAVGHLFCAAAGNNGTNIDSSAFYPAAYDLDNLISVAATDNDDAKASFSNWGSTRVDLGAPGVLIASTYPGNSYVYMSGTSMACPHVAGVAALVYGQNPGWTYGQVRDRIFSTVRPAASMAGKTVTGGILDAAAALGSAPANTPPDVAILTPAGGSSAALGQSVSFSGTASDNDDGDLGASLVWTSDLQGVIGNGASFQRDDLVAGTHTITASVTDSGGLGGSAQITLTITSPNLTPAAPGSVSATDLGGGNALVSWSDLSDNEDGFEIERQDRVGRSWVNVTAGTTGPGTTSFVDHPGSGRFKYRVRSFNVAGSSAWVGWVNVRVR